MTQPEDGCQPTAAELRENHARRAVLQKTFSMIRAPSARRMGRFTGLRGTRQTRH